jgi:hypothetical protein
MLGGLSLCEVGNVNDDNDEGYALEAVGFEAIDTRSDQSRRTITFGVDTAACRTVVPKTHPATRGYNVHRDAESGVPYSTAGKSFVWDEGRRVLVAKQPSGEILTIDSRQAQVRRPLMAVKPMTQQGQWVCFGPDRAFAYKIDTGRIIPFEPTPTGWNLTVELEAPNEANKKVNEVMEMRASEQRVDEQRSTLAPEELPSRIKQMIQGMGNNRVSHVTLSDGVGRTSKARTGAQVQGEVCQPRVLGQKCQDGITRAVDGGCQG